MSGTRKMGKFELDALVSERAELLDAPGGSPSTMPEPASVSVPPVETPSSTSLPPTPSTAPVPEPTPRTDGVEALRTRLAQKFVTLADTVTEAFRDFAIGSGAWAVELTQPQGPSTGGGQQALQHLRMRPRRTGFSVLVAGTVNPIAKTAELRDHDHVMAMHEVRHRQPLQISRQEWEQFLRKAEVVLNGAGIQSMRTPPPRELLDQRRSQQRVSQKAVVAFVVVSILALIVAWRVVVALLNR